MTCNYDYDNNNDDDDNYDNSNNNNNNKNNNSNNDDKNNNNNSSNNNKSISFTIQMNICGDIYLLTNIIYLFRAQSKIRLCITFEH